MPAADKYHTDDPDFDQAHGLLRNRLGIVDPVDLERAETEANRVGFGDLILSYSERLTFLIPPKT